MVNLSRFLVILFIVGLLGFLATPNELLAEYKSDTPSGQNIAKLPATPDDPKLLNGHVYPNWGPVCQRYTYSVIYVDDKGRAPEYVKIYFNGQMYDMEKEDPASSDYFRGVKYVYKYVPKKLGSNFYFFEASNGLGKARSNIIDSPDNGPVLFNSAFEKNEIAVVDASQQTKILAYDVGDEWVGGVALSDDGKYLAAKTHKKIYLFDTSKPDNPIWVYEGPGERPGDVKGGIDISGDGSRIFASIGGRGILFDNKSNEPLWIYQGTNNAYNAAISKDGKYMAMGTAGGVSSTADGYQSFPDTNLLILWNEKSEAPLWQYHTEGNWHDVSLSDDGSFITGATGCPDRRFYLFSKDSNKPVIRSEMLTKDSPVHRAKISGDGRYAAVGSESNDGAVFLFFQDSSTPVWKAPMPDRSSVRALNFTSDGKYIGAATFKGDVFIFGRDSDNPIAHWNVANVSLGGVDIAEDGSFIAAGGTDNKLHIFPRDSAVPKSIDFNEYVQEVDIAANGKYIAAGTGGSVYFFEAFEGSMPPAVECQEIKEPPVEEATIINQPLSGNAVIKDARTDKKQWPGMLFGFGFLGSLMVLAGYIGAVKYGWLSKLKRIPVKEMAEIQSADGREERLKLNRKIVTAISAVSLIFLVLTVMAGVINGINKQKLENSGKQGQEAALAEEGEIKETGCGNSMCEPDRGETKASCPQDCLE
ncbi:MAG: WD40 repeat domain-containing protein [bacterium]|nr:WD40 repeat domain-containing protein [bacterium]